MGLQTLTFFLLLLGCVWAAPASQTANKEKVAAFQSELDQDKDDLKTASSSSYTQRSYDYGGYPSGYNGYSVTGYGSLDNYNSGNGYDNTYGYNSGYNSGYNGYGSGYSGYGGSGYSRNGGYGLTGYGSSGGGYGGWGGNGGLNSYYGYSNPSYQGNYNLGYGYYNKRPGYGNIYNNGITPNLVTGYRGYSR